MKRLIAGTAMLALSSGVFASGLAEDNPDLYGNIIWDKDLQERVERGAERDRELPRTIGPVMGETYGSILHDVGTDPYAEVHPLDRVERPRTEFRDEELPRTIGPVMGETYGSILHDVGVDPYGEVEE